MCICVYACMYLCVLHYKKKLLCFLYIVYEQNRYLTCSKYNIVGRSCPKLYNDNYDKE